MYIYKKIIQCKKKAYLLTVYKQKLYIYYTELFDLELFDETK